MTYPARKKNKLLEEPIVYDELTPKQVERYIQYCRNSSLWYLGKRDYTRKQLQEKLDRKKIPRELSDPALDKLVDDGYIDDRKYAEQFVYSSRTYKKTGKRVIAMELQRAGITPDEIEEVLEDIDQDDELQTAQILAAKSLKSSTKVERTKRITRAVSALARKGYSSSMAFQVVNEYLAEEAEEALAEEESRNDFEEPSESELEHFN